MRKSFAFLQSDCRQNSAALQSKDVQINFESAFITKASTTARRYNETVSKTLAYEAGRSFAAQPAPPNEPQSGTSETVQAFDAMTAHPVTNTPLLEEPA